MTELKTMKDFKEGFDELDRLQTTNKAHADYLFREIRQEAIKQIKDLFEKNKTAKTMQDRQEAIWNEAVIRWIKHFFNIKDEEVSND